MLRLLVFAVGIGSDDPFHLFVFALLAQALAVFVGRFFKRPFGLRNDDERKDFDVILAAMLTLLALVVGFTFSMSVTRYDIRKGYEVEESTAIGTAFWRADLLPAEEARRIRGLLRQYLDRRIETYLASDGRSANRMDGRMRDLQIALWSAVVEPANRHSTDVIALAVGGMNEVFDAQEHTHAAWGNRIPSAAWLMLIMTAIACNGLIGYGERSRTRLVFVLPVIVAVSFLLIADIDSPRGGVIKVLPKNLLELSQSIGES